MHRQLDDLSTRVLADLQTRVVGDLDAATCRYINRYAICSVQRKKVIQVHGSRAGSSVCEQKCA